ncbi:MAG: helix-turn-helix domain-containing protein [Planctomycetes bacterium]|nr:helix-turn-helix domain-containing protein [Planctomycetota bacterium]
MADEFYDFDKALNELSMEEEELKRLVSAGEIRAFRSKGQMKFRKQDIDELRRSERRSAGEPEETLTDELVFDEADQISLDDEEGMATAKIDEQDTLIDEELPEIESDLSDLEAAPPAGRTPSKGRTTVTRRATRVTRMREADEARKAASPVFAALMILTALLMLYGVAILSNIATNNNTGMTKGVSEFMVDSFASGS